MRTPFLTIVAGIALLVTVSSLRGNMAPRPWIVPAEPTATNVVLLVTSDDGPPRLMVSQGLLYQLAAPRTGSVEGDVIKPSIGFDISSPARTVVGGIALSVSIAFAGLTLVRNRGSRRPDRASVAIALVTAAVLGAGGVALWAGTHPRRQQVNLRQIGTAMMMYYNMQSHYLQGEPLAVKLQTIPWAGNQLQLVLSRQQLAKLSTIAAPSTQPNLLHIGISDQR